MRCTAQRTRRCAAGFKFPILLSMSHMAFCFLALLPVMLAGAYRPLHLPSINKQWLGLLGVGLFFGANMGLNNASMLTISLSLNQVIRCDPPDRSTDRPQPADVLTARWQAGWRSCVDVHGQPGGPRT